eukprot:IDg3940t1
MTSGRSVSSQSLSVSSSIMEIIRLAPVVAPAASNPAPDDVLEYSIDMQQREEPDKDTSDDHIPEEDSQGSTDTSNPEADHYKPDTDKKEYQQKEQEPRRSHRVRRSPSEWRNTTALLAETPESKLSFSAATKWENANNWIPAI